MKRFGLILMLLLIALGASSNLSYAQEATGFSGAAVRWNGEPIVGATIAVLSGPLETDSELASTTTAADGTWSIGVPQGGPYWVHIRTFGSWWGYSYHQPFSLRAGEQISQVYLVLGPRDVREIVLPTPVSNIAPATGEGDEEPVSDVKPAIGAGGEDEMPVGMPRTGGNASDNLLIVLFGAAVLALISGLGFRKLDNRI